MWLTLQHHHQQKSRYLLVLSLPPISDFRSFSSRSGITYCTLQYLWNIHTQLLFWFVPKHRLLDQPKHCLATTRISQCYLSECVKANMKHRQIYHYSTAKYFPLTLARYRNSNQTCQLYEVS